MSTQTYQFSREEKVLSVCFWIGIFSTVWTVYALIFIGERIEPEFLRYFTVMTFIFMAAFYWWPVITKPLIMVIVRYPIETLQAVTICALSVGGGAILYRLLA